MSKSPSRRFPVTVTQLPVTRCQICQRTVAYRPGTLTEVLTEHYRRAHPEVPGVYRSSPGQAAALPRGNRHRRRLPPGDLARAGRESASGHAVAAPRKGPHIEPPNLVGYHNVTMPSITATDLGDRCLSGQ